MSGEQQHKFTWLQRFLLTVLFNEKRAFHACQQNKEIETSLTMLKIVAINKISRQQIFEWLLVGGLKI